MSTKRKQISKLQSDCRDLTKRVYLLSASMGDKTLTEETRARYQQELLTVNRQREEKEKEITRLRTNQQQLF